MSSVYGSDIATPDDGDINRSMSTDEGPAIVVQAAIRRLTDTLFYDSDYGYPVLDALINTNITTSADTVAAAIETELKKDDRIQDVDASVTIDGETVNIRIELTLVAPDEFSVGQQFTLISNVNTLTASQLTFDIS